MIQQMKLENDALKAGLKEASIKTQQQTKQLEDRFRIMRGEKAERGGANWGMMIA